MSDSQTMAMLERRRIEAAILKHVYDTLKASHGIEAAQKTIAEAVRKSAMEQAAADGGRRGARSLQTFIDRQEPWLRGDALTSRCKEKSDTRYRYNVTRCKYAEMYRDMGLGEIGHLLSCQRDGTFCEGYDARIKLKRTQTLMQGASHCDFDYTFEEDGTGEIPDNLSPDLAVGASVSGNASTGPQTPPFASPAGAPWTLSRAPRAGVFTAALGAPSPCTRSWESSTGSTSWPVVRAGCSMSA